jgi:hypothetical protein
MNIVPIRLPTVRLRDRIRSIEHIYVARTCLRAHPQGCRFCQHIRWHSPSKRGSLSIRSIEINVRSIVTICIDD